MNIKIKLLFIFTFLFLVITPSVYAVSSSFFNNADKWYNENCKTKPEKVRGMESVLCYTFDKLQELQGTDTAQNQKISDLENKNTQQAEQITKLQGDVAQLKGLFGGSVLGIPTPSLSSCYSPSNTTFTITMVNEGDIGGWIGLDENKVVGGSAFINLGFFAPHETKKRIVSYEVNDSQVKKWDGSNWVLVGWYSLHATEHINLGWICP